MEGKPPKLGVRLYGLLTFHQLEEYRMGFQYAMFYVIDVPGGAPIETLVWDIGGLFIFSGIVGIVAAVVPVFANGSCDNTAMQKELIFGIICIHVVFGEFVFPLHQFLCKERRDHQLRRQIGRGNGHHW